MPRILVVDDDDDIRLCVRDRLVIHGYEVDTAASGEEVLRLADLTQYDGILLDLIMAGVPGLATLHELRARGIAVPVIAMSSDHAALQRALIRGADAILSKPIAFDELDGIVRTTIAKPTQRRAV